MEGQGDPGQRIYAPVENGVSDGIIDLTRYLKPRPEPSGAAGGGGTFALWGAEDERSRFALPLWRAVYLAGGARGGVVSREKAGVGASPQPFVVLDLQHDPADLDFPPAALDPLDGARVPALEEGRGGTVTVALGENEAGVWYLVVDGIPDDRRLAGRDREDLLFLAGECAGLLFLQSLAPGSGGPDEHP